MASLGDLDLAALTGKTVDDARALVIAAGGVTRIVAPGSAVTADFRDNRVTLVVEDGRIVGTPVLG
jgi:hypothetical protein